jgi:hypothetical protein
MHKGQFWNTTKKQGYNSKQWLLCFRASLNQLFELNVKDFCCTIMTACTLPSTSLKTSANWITRCLIWLLLTHLFGPFRDALRGQYFASDQEVKICGCLACH